jgi:peroxiredoxin
VRVLLLSTALLLAAGPVQAESSHDFELYDLSDRLVSLSRLRSAARLVLVDFFSETCQPCKAGLPALRRLHARFARKGLALIIVAVPGGDDRGQALRATERVFAGQPVPFPVVWDKYRRVAAQYGVVGAPPP